MMPPGLEDATMKVLIADKIDAAAIERMQAAGLDVTVETGLKPEELRKEIAPYDAVAIRSAAKITSDIIESARNLKLVVRAGVGLDNVDQAAAKKKGIEVRNTPGATAVSVAEHVLGMMLALVRHIPQANEKLRKGVWDKKSFMGEELFGKTLGIIGFGRIGREVARRAHAFTMEVIAYDPHIDQGLAEEFNVPLRPLDELVESSDFITLNLPLTSETKNLLNRERICRMKQGARLVNCARGGIVDEVAIADAIRDGKLAGASFDVFAEEPLSKSPLMELDQVILTPHLGASTKEGQRRAGLELADIVIEFSKKLQNC